MQSGQPLRTPRTTRTRLAIVNLLGQALDGASDAAHAAISALTTGICALAAGFAGSLGAAEAGTCEAFTVSAVISLNSFISRAWPVPPCHQLRSFSPDSRTAPSRRRIRIGRPRGCRVTPAASLPPHRELAWHGTRHGCQCASHLVRDLVGFARDRARNSAGSVSSLDLIPAQSPKLGISSRVRT
jgi:hypothetical protein